MQSATQPTPQPSRKRPDKLHETPRRATQRTTVAIHAVQFASTAAASRTKF